MFIVKYRLVGAYSDKVLSEHVKQVGRKGKWWKRPQEFFTVTQECVVYRHYIVALFVKAAAAVVVQDDGKSAVKQFFDGFGTALNLHAGVAVRWNIRVRMSGVTGVRHVVLFRNALVGVA